MAHRSARPVSALRSFLDSEAAGGIVLMAAAACALLVANSPLHALYEHLLHLATGPTITKKLGPMTVHLWINDALMAVFFLLVGLEIKREFVDGRLASWRQRRLPFIAAVGGMAVPAAIYLLVTRSAGIDGIANGWAIPAATDIAFAIGVMALLGSRVPTSLKLLLTTVAIVDDMLAVLIIALAYTAAINGAALLCAAAIFGAMLAANRLGVRSLAFYLAGFAVLWLAILVSGVHATIAGVLAAFTVPVVATPGAPDAAESPLHRLEHALHGWVAFLIVPLFGFANAGLALGPSAGGWVHPAALGIALALFVGKQLGIFASIWLAVRLGLAGKPRGASWMQVYGVSLLCGIGFTMSLFIAMLAFAGNDGLIEEAKRGVLAGSVLAGLAGYAVLRFARPPAAQAQADADVDREIDADGDVLSLEEGAGR